MRRLWWLLLFVPCGCFSGGNTGPNETINVSGAWRGEVRLAVGADTIAAPAELDLEQSPNSGEITGALSYLPIGEGIQITGFVESAVEIILTVSPEQTETSDCHNYPQVWVVRPISGELRVRQVSGRLCEGDGAGGHLPLRTVTGGSGTLLRE